MRRLLYGPPRWIVERTTAEDRRMFGFWTFVLAVVLTPWIGETVIGVYALSVLALIPNFTSETPVEKE
jgi:hypothetical protein